MGVAGGEGGRGRKGGASGHRSLVVTLKQGALPHVSTNGPFITDSCSLLGITDVPFLLECQRPAQEPGFFTWVHGYLGTCCMSTHWCRPVLFVGRAV